MKKSRVLSACVVFCVAGAIVSATLMFDRARHKMQEAEGDRVMRRHARLWDAVMIFRFKHANQYPKSLTELRGKSARLNDSDLELLLNAGVYFGGNWGGVEPPDNAILYSSSVEFEDGSGVVLLKDGSVALVPSNIMAPLKPNSTSVMVLINDGGKFVINSHALTASVRSGEP